MSVTVLTGPNGGLFLRIQNDVTGEVAGEVVPREAAEALVEQASATLRCAPLDPCAGAVARMAVWDQRHAGGQCPDCDPRPAPCICEIADPLIGRAHSRAEISILDDAMNGRR